METTSYTRRLFLQAGGLGVLGLATGTPANAQPAAAQPAAQPAEQPLPARQPADRLDGPPFVSARAWAIGEGRTGRLLWSANEAAALNMASTTKIMTAHLTLRSAAEHAKLLDETMTISAVAAKTGGSSARIQTGDRFTVRDMLYGLLLPSGNDAAVALAEHLGPKCNPPKDTPAAAAFVAEMNRRAAALKMGETRYFDPHGLGKNQTSARDLLKLAHSALQDQLFRQYVQTRRHRCEATDAKGEKRPVVWNNTNRLLEIEGYDGIKTGTTTAAGFCLVSSGRRNDDHLIVAVLGATSNDSRYIDTRNLFRWAWLQRGHKK